MKNKKFTLIILIICLSISTLLSGCTSIEDIQVRFGLKNKDFEYIKDNKIDKIIIQSTRDTGFKFIVTDKKTILELYDILSTANQVPQKSTLEPDYIFEMYQGDEVHKFSYITGLEKKDVGNLYNEDKTYIVSKRIDNDIIRNLWNLRKPRDFELVYYKSILNVLAQYNKEINKGGTIGVDLSEDVDVAKYIFSTDLEAFKEDLQSIPGNMELINKNKENFDIVVTVKTLGYKTDRYRSMVTVNNKKDKSEQKFYTGSRYENGEWTIRVDKTPFEAQ
jgi:hypothetical protein